MGKGCASRMASSNRNSGRRFSATATSPTLIAGEIRNGCMIRE
jgi:hypothetical protein